MHYFCCILCETTRHITIYQGMSKKLGGARDTESLDTKLGRTLYKVKSLILSNNKAIYNTSNNTHKYLF